MKKLHFISRNWRKENLSVACGASPINIYFSDYLKRFVNKINEVYVKLCNSDILLRNNSHIILFIAIFIVECCNRLFPSSYTSYCVGMVSVTSASISQSRPSMYIQDSQYDQEVPQSQTGGKPVRKSHTTITRHQQDKSNQLSLPHQDEDEIEKSIPRITDWQNMNPPSV